MRRLSILAMVLACGACQPLPDATVAGTTAAAENPDAQPAAAQPACSSYTAPVTVGGQQQQASRRGLPAARWQLANYPEYAGIAAPGLRGPGADLLLLSLRPRLCLSRLLS